MYLLDTNVFIEASRLYYHPDIAPYFWQWLREQHEAGNVGSIEAVKKEIDGGGKKKLEPLSLWAAQLPKSFWAAPDVSTVQSFRTLTDWVQHPDRQYRDDARREFLAIADFWIVAQAHGTGQTVVTRELAAPDSKKRVLIPDACNGIGVSFQEPFSMYRKLGLNFRC
ncbi:DUF4411 family protein [Corynebacterium phocae]|nr:DUF4411 family protein [Corynebacterium phocae]KAA8723891.1 DUF4411 family protein [Corynebacterium phocae]